MSEWAEVERLASLVVSTYATQASVGFAYGQGSAFTGLSVDSDIDIVIIWDLDEVPDASARRAGRPGGTCDDPIQFDGESFALDKLQVDGRDVDVAHFTRATFDSWCTEVAAGDGWQVEVWPLPLHAVAGFVNGVILADSDGAARRVRQALHRPSPQLTAKTVTTLAQQLDGYANELEACLRRDDAWLVHHLVSRLMRLSYLAWFAAEGYYCPFPKHMRQWIQRLGLDREAARLDEEVWAATTAAERVDATRAFARLVVDLHRGESG